MNVQGEIHLIFDSQQISATFKKREFVVKIAENPQFPQLVKFETIQDRCELLNQFKPGDLVDISFNLKGREWVNPKGERVYFTTIEAWRIVSVGAGQQPAHTQHNAQTAYNKPAGQNANTLPSDFQPVDSFGDPVEADDLPF